MSVTMTQSLPDDTAAVPPFPKGLPAIELPRISLKGLLEDDKDEIDKIFDICISTGFFYLNLQDHPDGRQLWEEASRICDMGKETLPILDMDTKLAYKSREKSGVFDMGYKCPSISKNGEPKFSEAFNASSFLIPTAPRSLSDFNARVPLYELLVDKTSSFRLPSWLADHQDLFGAILMHGNKICLLLLSTLEKMLQVKPGTLSFLHKVEDPSNDFLRVLRYPATLHGEDANVAKFPPHRDSVSVAMLFTWVGGLQILEPSSSSNPSTGGYDESSWRWVEPVDGHVIVNLGDALAVLTNKVLKSGFHRVIGAPGAQSRLDKFSVLLGYRPALSTPMRPIDSPIVTPLNEEQAKAPVQTCEEWGAQRVAKVYQVLEDRKT